MSATADPHDLSETDRDGLDDATNRAEQEEQPKRARRRRAPVATEPVPVAVAAEPQGEVPREPAASADSTLDAALAEDGAEGRAAPPDAERPRAERGRRRGRRDRKRGPRIEGDLDQGDAQGDAEPAREAALPADAGQLFADVVAGGSDAESEPEAEVEADAGAKRVLPPEPDAPKLQKVLAQSGIGSRRDLEDMIADGRITVNGDVAHTGQRIAFGDRIEVDGRPVRYRIAPALPRVLAYHKPVGEVVTTDDPQQRPTVFRRLPRLPQGKWQSVGRLDINTEGLLLFTNSGDLANQLMHPRFGVEREYAVRVQGTLVEDQRDELVSGVDIDGHEASFRSIEDGGGEGTNHWYRVVITEGRNREVRRLFDAVGLTVSRLIRIRYGSVVLPRGLKRGVWVDLGEGDVRAIRRLAGGEGARGPRGRDQRGQNGSRNRAQERVPRRDTEPDQDEHDIGPIPNPLEQTFDRRFVSKQRGFSGFGAGGSGAGGSGSGAGGSGAGGSGAGGGNRKRGDAPRQPDPLQTSLGYIGADAFHRKGGRGRGGGGFGGGRRGR